MTTSRNVTSANQPDEPACAEGCGGLLKRISLRSGTEVDVSVAPLDRGYQADHTFTCPHGVRWWVQPTERQIAYWNAEQIP